ncbi:MAG: P83/100 family protein [Leptonema sp. (in: bacteria)]
MTTLNNKIGMSILIFITLLKVLNPQDNPKIAEEAIKGEPIRFINRNNRVVDLKIQEAQIQLGGQLANGISKNNVSQINNIIIKRFFDPELENFGADVIILTEKTNYGHINAIERILMGYLQTAFQYNLNQARTLSELIVYYNARLRQNQKLIQTSYAKDVIENIDIRKAGIDRFYKNWPGKTQLLIPLRKNIVRPENTDLDRKEIQDVIEKDKTIPEQKKEELKKIDEERKKEDIKNLENKEKEIVKKEEQLKKQEETIKKEETNIKKQLQDTNKKLEELKKDPEKNKEQIKEEEKKVQNLEEQQKKVEEKKEELKKQEQIVQEEKKEVEEQKKQQVQETTRKDEQKQEDKQPASKIEQLEKEKEELKKEIEKKEQISENVINEKIVFLKVLRFIEGGHFNNELWMVDPNKDDALFRGNFTNICSRSFLPIEGIGIVVIGYEGSSHSQTPHHLFLLDADKLEVKGKSKEQIMFNSFLVYKDNKIYAIEQNNDQYYLVRFNEKLEIDARSSNAIHPYSEITFFKDKIYLTGSEKSNQVPIQVYSRKDLKLLKIIEPDQKTTFSK